MTPDEMQKKFGPIILIAGLAVAASLYFKGGDDDPYRKDIDKAIEQQKEIKKKELDAKSK